MGHQCINLHTVRRPSQRVSTSSTTATDTLVCVVFVWGGRVCGRVLAQPISKISDRESAQDQGQADPAKSWGRLRPVIPATKTSKKLWDQIVAQIQLRCKLIATCFVCSEQVNTRSCVSVAGSTSTRSTSSVIRTRVQRQSLVRFNVS